MVRSKRLGELNLRFDHEKDLQLHSASFHDVDIFRRVTYRVYCMARPIGYLMQLVQKCPNFKQIPFFDNVNSPEQLSVLELLCEHILFQGYIEVLFVEEKNLAEICGNHVSQPRLLIFEGSFPD